MRTVAASIATVVAIAAGSLLVYKIAFAETYDCKMTSAQLCTSTGCDKFAGGTTRLDAGAGKYSYCVFKAAGCVDFNVKVTRDDGGINFSSTDSKDGTVLGFIAKNGFISVTVGGSGSIITAAGKCS